MATIDCTQNQNNFSDAKHCVIEELKSFVQTDVDIKSTIGDYNNINKTVQDGQIVTSFTPVTTNQNVVIYENDPQLFSPEFNFKIETLTNCNYDLSSQTYSPPDNSTYSFVNNSAGNLEPHINFDSLQCSNQNQPLENIFLIEALTFLPLSYTETIPIDTSFESINDSTATQLLDTNIYELLSDQENNLDRILAFFQEYQFLKGTYPSFIDIDGDGQGDDFADNNAAIAYRSSHDINSSTLPEGSIPRLNEDVSLTGYSELQDDVFPKTLEALRNDLNLFLRDIDYIADTADTRPIYEDRSSGYLKIRNMNQAIIIRNEEGNDIGLEDWESDGFTITMWVKFLDKVNDGTLFNYGNPFRTDNPKGFSLETFIGSGEKRYVKLTVRETSGITGADRTIDSHVGTSGHDKVNLSTATPDDSQYTEIPVDLNEWYFIVATYDTTKDDTLAQNMLNNEDYWMGNCVDNQTCASLSHTSVYGNKCKVEIISKSDLLLARGFKQE